MQLSHYFTLLGALAVSGVTLIEEFTCSGFAAVQSHTADGADPTLPFLVVGSVRR